MRSLKARPLQHDSFRRVSRASQPRPSPNFTRPHMHPLGGRGDARFFGPHMFLCGAQLNGSTSVPGVAFSWRSAMQMLLLAYVAANQQLSPKSPPFENVPNIC